MVGTKDKAVVGTKKQSRVWGPTAKRQCRGEDQDGKPWRGPIGKAAVGNPFGSPRCQGNSGAISAVVWDVSGTLLGPRTVRELPGRFLLWFGTSQVPFWVSGPSGQPGTVWRRNRAPFLRSGSVSEAFGEETVT